MCAIVKVNCKTESYALRNAGGVFLLAKKLIQFFYAKLMTFFGATCMLKFFDCLKNCWIFFCIDIGLCSARSEYFGSFCNLGICFTCRRKTWLGSTSAVTAYQAARILEFVIKTSCLSGSGFLKASWQFLFTPSLFLWNPIKTSRLMVTLFSFLEPWKSWNKCFSLSANRNIWLCHQMEKRKERCKL